MSYKENYKFQQQSNQQTDTSMLAVDWDAKKIPLMAYKSCLATLEDLQITLIGKAHKDPMFLRQQFISNLLIFFYTVEVEFTAYLDKQTDKKITIQSYLDLLEKKNKSDIEIITLFRELKNWSFRFGAFRTYIDIEEEKDVFDRIEEESI
jgi:hypothetical protein